MQLTIYYMLVPTDELVKVAQEAGQDWLLEPDVWIDIQHDRTGREHPREQVEQAAWTVFLAKIACPRTEDESHRRFRERCLELGFAGCWVIHEARAGGPVDDLLEYAKENQALAKQAGYQGQIP